MYVVLLLTSNTLKQFAKDFDKAILSTGLKTEVIAKILGIGPRSVYRWRKGASLPRIVYFERLEAFFRQVPDVNLHELEVAYDVASAKFETYKQNVEQIEPTAIEQVPAAYRFGVQDEKIDALPERPETLERDIAADFYDGFRQKLVGVAERLMGSNVDPYVTAAVERLLLSRGRKFDDVRPGVVLSHFRSIEGVIAGFNSEEGRQALFPDAIAMLNDVNLRGQDFLACFPNVPTH